MSEMHCSECVSGVLKCTSSQGGVESGPFCERWMCSDCGAEGTVSGQAEDEPTEWERDGEAFA